MSQSTNYFSKQKAQACGGNRLFTIGSVNGTPAKDKNYQMTSRASSDVGGDSDGLKAARAFNHSNFKIQTEEVD